jgi:hypothetical protein
MGRLVPRLTFRPPLLALAALAPLTASSGVGVGSQGLMSGPARPEAPPDITRSIGTSQGPSTASNTRPPVRGHRRVRICL